MEPYKRSFKITIGVALAAIAAIFIYNRIADPYGLYRVSNNESIAVYYSKNKPRLYKPWAIYDIRPQSVAFGRSRFYYGIDMEHPGWKGATRFNFAIPGATMYETYKYFLHSVNAGNLAQAVIEIEEVCDTEDFQSGFNPDDILESKSAYAFHAIQRFKYLISLETLRTTVAPDKSDRDAPHHLGQNTFFNEFAFRQKGHRFALYHREKRTYEYIVKSLNKDLSQCTTDLYEKLLRLAHDNNVDLTIVTSPQNVRSFEMFFLVGVFDIYEEYKRLLVSVNEKVAKSLDREPFPIYDFATYSELNCEEFPSSGDTQTTMKYWYENSHYKKLLGDYMLDRIFGIRDPERPWDTDFGIRIDSKNIDEHLRNIRSAHQKWNAGNPDDVKEIQAIINEDKMDLKYHMAER